MRSKKNLARITTLDSFSVVIGLGGCLLTTITGTVNEIVGVICTSSIALCTCFVQLYRLWRDRDTDLKKRKTRKTKVLSEDEKLSNIIT